MVPWSRRLNQQTFTWSRLSNQLWSVSHWLPFLPVLLFLFPLTARARTRERADAQPIFTKNSRALYLINSAQIEKSHVDGALALAAIAVWQGMKNSTHLLGSCGPNSGILHLYPIGEAAPGLYGARTWRMTCAKFSDSQCDLQPASELFPSAPRGGVV